MSDPQHDVNAVTHDNDDYETGYDARGLIDLYGRWHKLGARLVYGGMLLALALVILFAVLQPPPPPPPDVSKVGVHLLLDDGRDHWEPDLWDEHMAYAAQMAGSGGIAVQVIRADDLDTARWQRFLDLCQEHDLTPVLRLATTYDFDNDVWNPPQPDDDGRYHGLAAQYADFINGLTWYTPEKHIILLNEPNNGHEWGGRPDAAAYARFLVDVASGLREAVPQVRLLNGALDLHAPHTGSQPFEDGLYYVDADSFMETMLQTEPEVFSYVDIWNSHAYPGGGFRAPPWEQERGFHRLNDAPQGSGETVPEGINNRGINGYEWELWKLQTCCDIDSLPVMITEAGWRYATESHPEYLPANKAAEYLDMAMRGNPGRYPAYPRSGWTPWLSDERVQAVAVFALNGVPETWAHTNLLNLTDAGSVTGTTPLFDLLTQYQTSAQNVRN